MTMQDDLSTALNIQINHEFGAAYVYLGMAAYFESRDLDGFAGWMRTQSEEERSHGMRIYDHLAARDVPISLGQAGGHNDDVWRPAGGDIRGS